MESSDTHLCLRCGFMIYGLGNYVAHRQQNCYKSIQTASSPFLSDAAQSENFESPFLLDASRHIYNPESEAFSPASVCGLSANDFFSALNLLSKPDTERNTNEDLNSALEIQALVPSLESELENVCNGTDTLEQDIALLTEAVFDENSPEFPAINGFDNISSVPDSDLDVTFPDISENSSIEPIRKVGHPKKQKSKQYGFISVPTTQMPRTSYRQKIYANISSICCRVNKEPFKCTLCFVSCSFIHLYMEHLLVCNYKHSEKLKWTEVIFHNQTSFVHTTHFRCLLCSFYCNDSLIFLSHLKDTAHCRNAAHLKNPLICLPCQEECGASDEMKQHFTKVHSNHNKKDHPILVLEMKKNVHCCHCLTQIKNVNYLQSSGAIKDISNLDKDFLKSCALHMPHCAYGIDKTSLNSYISILSSTSFEKKLIEISDNTVSDELTQSESEVEIIAVVKKQDTVDCTVSPTEITEKKQRHKKSFKSLTVKLKREGNGRYVVKRSTLKNTCTCNMCGEELTCLSLGKHRKMHFNRKKVAKALTAKAKFSSKLVKNKFLCDTCGYIGNNLNLLQRHKRSHTGYKPFKCSDCGHSFALSSQLLRHKRLHSGSKPYKCAYCDYTCNTQENLRKHILKTKKHKGKPMYPCQYCDFNTNGFNSFRSHLLKCHSEDFPTVKEVESSAVAGLYEKS